jgi:major vault protein
VAEEKNRDLLLHPDTYAFMSNEGKNGIVNVYVGPGVVNQTGQDKPVAYDPATRTYKQVTLDGAVRPFPRAEEGDYVVLENPAIDDKFPTNNVQQAAPLNKGRRVIIPGPWSNALWPGQNAKVIEGHRLRSNQFLVVTVYNEEEAKKNWKRAIVKTVDGTEKEPTGQRAAVFDRVFGRAGMKKVGVVRDDDEYHVWERTR